MKQHFDFSLTELFSNAPQIIVVHIGASIVADHAERYARLAALGRARVVAFEPNEGEYAKLTAQFGQGYMFLPYFIGRGGPARYYETNVPVTGSLLEPNYDVLDRFQSLGDLTRVTAVHQVVTHRLDDVPELTDADYIKIDVQGAEMDVFNGAERLLRAGTLIETEVAFAQLYKGQPLFGDIDVYLRGQGFQFHTLRNVCGRCFVPLYKPGNPSGAFNQMLWADAVYVKDMMALERLSTDKLIKLAILLHDVYGSIDLCMRALMELEGRPGQGPGLQQAYLARIQAEMAAAAPQ